MNCFRHILVVSCIISWIGPAPSDAQNIGGRVDHPATPYLAAGYLQKVATGEAAGKQSDTIHRVVAVYAIQVGAFSVHENAVKLVDLMKSKGFSAIIYDNLLDGKHLLHLVWVGRYDRFEDAVSGIAKIEELTGIRGVLREQMIWRRR